MSVRPVTPVGVGVEITVDVADFAVASGDSTLITLGLGSCVALALHDPVTGIAGLAHILLPSIGTGPPSIRAARFEVGPSASASSPAAFASTTTSPVWIPMRAAIRRASGRSLSARWIWSPARIARPASSSCACGQPK